MARLRSDAMTRGAFPVLTRAMEKKCPDMHVSAALTVATSVHHAELSRFGREKPQHGRSQVWRRHAMRKGFMFEMDLNLYACDLRIAGWPGPG
jgi:hypothetical protein